MDPPNDASFGHAFRQHFMFNDKYLSLNHGSFGTYPRRVRDHVQALRASCEEAPDQFIRYDSVGLLDEARSHAARLLHAPVDECVFVENATTGVNTILRNLRFGDKDSILYFSTVYGAVEKTLFSLVETTPHLQLRKVAYQLPCTHDEIVQALSHTIADVAREGRTPRVCVFETITSVPGIRMPFEQITAVCRAAGLLSLIDGAHGVGQIPLDLTELDADFFVSNCHKWLYTPRGCAVFHVPKRNQHLIRTTLPTSWGWTPRDETGAATPTLPGAKSTFVKMFDDVGTADNCAYYCVPAALEFRRQFCGGEDAIYTHIRDIAQRGADELAQSLGTDVMDDQLPGSRTSWAGGLRDCALANVRLPIPVTGLPEGAATAGIESTPNGGISPVHREDLASQAAWMTRVLAEEYHIGVSIYAYADQVWVRVSGQVWLELDDFVRLATALKEVLTRVPAGACTPSS